jgi:Mn-dependent DtxR family transcriptional regulator
MKSNESAEDYLESILVLSEKLPVVRSVDVSNDLGYKKSSISIAMKNLREKNLITMTESGYIYLTDEGRKIAETVYERHRFFAELLEKLGVDKVTAAKDACRIEHVISPESFAAIKKFFNDNNLTQ